VPHPVDRCAHQLGALLVAVAVALGGANGVRASDTPAAGISADLAKARARNIGDLRYELALSIPATRAQPVAGVNTLRFRLSEPSQPLVIDFDARGA